eukprot:TRINITY_DN3616_c0_g1_i2.p1 TRINITY_DN3616_c0_g1~~TRINITY_DN3616_c0_g1_i2.p1  ORF type:complete len:359 (-),score=61.46 TRINITY_DN3616_c0_g1_i2:44-1063(-)
MAGKLGFPHLVGPFTMQSVPLAGAINSFYMRNGFPKPDPSSAENSMAGMELRVMAEAMFLQLSPLHSITLDLETKKMASIPEEASFFAWGYPLVEVPGSAGLGGLPTNEKSFLTYGGFVYFNRQRDVVGTNAICPAPLGTPGLMFGRGQILQKRVEDELSRTGRFQEVTLDSLRVGGATHFAWIRPSEFSDVVASPDGCFAYRFEGGPSRYFPVVQTACFTPEMLQEELEDSEAWVVVRDERLGPVVEQVSIFDKKKSFEENMETIQTNRKVDTPAGGVRVREDNDLSGSEMTYEEWTQTADSGSCMVPWILRVPSDGAVGGETCSTDAAIGGKREAYF